MNNKKIIILVISILVSLALWAYSNLYRPVLYEVSSNNLPAGIKEQEKIVASLAKDIKKSTQINNSKNIIEDVSIDTAKWKTYQNEKFGFIFKYPIGFQISKQTSNSIEVSLTQEDNVEAINFISFTIEDNFKSLPLSEWFIENDKYFSKEEFEGFELRKNAGGIILQEDLVNINGKVAIKQRKFDEGGEYLSVFLSFDNLVIVARIVFQGSVYDPPSYELASNILFTDVKEKQLRYLSKEFMEEIFLKVLNEINIEK